MTPTIDHEIVNTAATSILQLAESHSASRSWPVSDEDMGALAIELGNAVVADLDPSFLIAPVRAKLLRPLKEFARETEDEAAGELVDGLETVFTLLHRAAGGRPASKSEEMDALPHQLIFAPSLKAIAEGEGQLVTAGPYHNLKAASAAAEELDGPWIAQPLFSHSQLSGVPAAALLKLALGESSGEEKEEKEEKEEEEKPEAKGKAKPAPREKRYPEDEDEDELMGVRVTLPVEPPRAEREPFDTRARPAVEARKLGKKMALAELRA